MKVHCAYCGKILQAAGERDEVSHGICQDCLPNLLEELQIPLEDYINAIPHPVVIIDADGRKLTFNEPFQNTFEAPEDITSELLDSLVLEANDDETGEEKLQQAPYKDTDTVRMLVERTRNTGRDVQDVKASAEITRKGAQKKKETVHIGTHRVGKNVVMEINRKRFSHKKR